MSKRKRGLGMTMAAIEEIAKTHSEEVHRLVQEQNERSIPALTEQENTGRGKTLDMSRVSAEDLGGGNSRKYIISRLKRDAPELAEQVISREISSQQGRQLLYERQGKAAKPRKETAKVSLFNATSARDTLTKYMPDDVLHELIDLLNEWHEAAE